MSYSLYKTCLKCSLVFIFMLKFQFSFEQYNFQKVPVWMKNNIENLGGRAVLVIVKDGKIIYQHAENNLSFKQWILEKGNVRANVVASPGLFGSFPWINNRKNYAGFLFVFNVNREGREQKYNELQKIINEQITN